MVNTLKNRKFDMILPIIENGTAFSGHSVLVLVIPLVLLGFFLVPILLLFARGRPAVIFPPQALGDEPERLRCKKSSSHRRHLASEGVIAPRD
jgi:hypothetical protein